MNKSLGIYNVIDEFGIKTSIKNVINNNVNFNTYTTPKGLKELRLEISNFINKIWDYKVNYNEMLITSGSQQSINLIVSAILKEGDTVLIEQPTYFGALDVFKQRNINLVGVDLQEDGLALKMLEDSIIKYSPKMIYVTPTFNNPTGYAWSNKNRKEFLEIINKYDITVLEDDPYSLINFTRVKYDSLYKLNKGKNIIYLGTFSKLISPSVNVGYILANEEVINKTYLFKKSFDLCTNAFIQYVVLDYLLNNDLERIVSKRIKIYKQLKRQSIKALNSEYKDQIEFISDSKGGLFYLVKFKDNINLDNFESGDNYFLDNNHSKFTRINICSEIDNHK